MRRFFISKQTISILFKIHAAVLDLDAAEDEGERIETALLQLSLSIEHKGETLAVLEGRKQMSSYLKGLRGASALRGKIHTASTFAEMESLLKEALFLSDGSEAIN